MATNAKLPPPPSANHVITGPPKGVVGGNRKKQKRRAKQAAKATTHPHGHPPVGGRPSDLDYDEDPLGYGDEDEYDYSDADGFNDHYLPPPAGPNGYSMPPPPAVTASRSKKRAGSSHHHHHHHSPYNPELLGNHIPHMPSPPPLSTGGKNIWNTSTQQERQNIKNFWLSLSEDERKSLLKIEKDAVLRKMKQQQKHSCSCTVCGRKRTAIEEELEVLYEGYYEELELYAHTDHPPMPSTDGMVPDPLHHRNPHPLALGPPPPLPHHRTSQLQEHFDDDEEFSEDEEEEEYSDDEYSDDEPEQPRRNNAPDFFSFGSNLTVKDNLLTVADDLLKNDGRKFIEMMEQLAERRMARENQAEFDAGNPNHPGAYPPGDPAYHEDPLAAGDEYDDDEASYDSQEEYDDDLDEEDDMGGLTEEQRVQEGRRMFQIFAARMFEQRVLTAYKEKVARERQQKLLEELEDETKMEAKKEAKKQRDAEKKKAKKKQQAAAKAEEKAKKDAEKAAEEAKVREVEEAKLEEQRRKKEEQRRKKEEGKRKQDEERAKKEAEKTRRLQDEQQRKEDAERKVREQRAAEKTKKDEARKREREERETREKEARERKTQEENEKKEREAKAKAERETKEREKTSQQAAQPPMPAQPMPQITKRPSQAGMVAVPPVLQKQASSGISSPHPSIAIPAIPKAPTPARQRQPSQHGSHASSPKQTQSQISSAPSKSSSPGSAAPQQPQSQQQPIGPPKTIMQKAGNQQAAPQPPHATQTTSPLPQQPMQPPPGMTHPQQHAPGGFGGMPPMGYGQFPGHQGPMMHPNMGQRGPMPMYPQQHGGPHMGMPNNRFGLAGINGMPQSPPGMMHHQQHRNMGFPFEAPGGGQPPPGFGPQQNLQRQPNQTPPIGQPPVSAAPGGEVSRPAIPTHSRQQSASDKERFESAANAPIARPTPIQRPSSVKPHSQERRGSNTDLDDLSKHLGSSALLGDDEPMPNNPAENRRSSNIPVNARGPQPGGMAGPLGTPFGAPAPGSFGASGWNPGLSAFGQTPGLPSLPAQQSWGTLPPNPSLTNSWANNNAAFSANSAFGPIGGSAQRPTGLSRPVTIRLAVCQACKQLSATAADNSDGFHHIDLLRRQMDAHAPHIEPPPQVNEIEMICETVGDSQNGGGELQIRRSDAAVGLFAVKWSPNVSTPDQHGRGGLSGLGEIGSPMPVKSSPRIFGAPGAGRGGNGNGAATAGAGFQSLGLGFSPAASSL